MVILGSSIINSHNCNRITTIIVILKKRMIKNGNSSKITTIMVILIHSLIVLIYFSKNYNDKGCSMVDKEICSKKQIGQLIRTRRKELKLTQEELAIFCELSINGISKIERGISDVRLSTLLKLKELLGCDIILRLLEE